jgi:hypothetical protein
VGAQVTRIPEAEVSAPDLGCLTLWKSLATRKADGGYVVIPPGREAHFGKYVDLNMLIMTGGLERTEDEFRTLLEASGFRLVRVVHTDSPISIVEVAPA